MTRFRFRSYPSSKKSSIPLELAGCLLFSLLFFSVNFALVVMSATNTVSIDLQASVPGKFELFWRSGSNQFSPERSLRVPFELGATSVTFTLPGGGLAAIRLDPGDGPGDFSISRVSLANPYFKQQEMDLSSYPTGTPVVSGIEDLAYQPEQGLVFQAINDDPWLVFPINKRSLDLAPAGKWLLAAVGTGLILFAVLCQRLLKGSRLRGNIIVETSTEDQAESSTGMLAVLNKRLGNVQLVSVIDSGGARRYRFAFTGGTGERVDQLATLLRESCAAVSSVRIQYHRSGEV
ncbi:hypothetical protein [Desulfobulbus alkaliphilus]|uniref:hypothetical protein n=1 Tax=Desulfobulbus alkaliphilus TaxID=869814 RepID=UPI001966607F|nr:hypothetical protein [Desulfobulbus alkaliphilus]MBM9537992.1 hypothetical protein [Desulfobulbus alkaliphilus]